MEDSVAEGCLSLADLDRYLESDERDPDVESHLGRCAACRERLETVRENNELFERVASATGGRFDAEPGAPSAPGEVPGYEILEEIHRGGQGIVYKAVQQSTSRTVALKMLLLGSLSTTRQRWRFEREIEMVAALRHPAVVTIYDSGVTPDGRPYYSMEFVEGVPLNRALPAFADARNAPARRRLLERRLGVFLLVCDAVAFAHRNGVIHRDLKPSNVLVDAEGCPHVLDFGVAKLLHAEGGANGGGERTMPGEFMGTLAYAAPEQLAGDPVKIDTRADVYALGIMLFELLTERKPFDTERSLADAIRAVTDVRPPTPSDVGPVADSELDAIVLMALEKREEDRYQSVDALSGDVRRYLASEPLLARRDSTWYVLRKTARRHAVPLSIGAAAIIALASIAVWMTFLYRKAQLEANRSNTMRVFLEDTLGSVPDTAQRSETTLRSVLDEAVQWVDIALADQPEIAASMRLTIGNSYRSLGLYDEAEREITQALEIRRSLLGSNHPDTATCINSIGLLDEDRGRFADAERSLREGYAIRARHFGPRHLSTAMSLMNISRLERKEGRLDDAERDLRLCLDIRREHFGEDHPDVAMCLFELASLRARRGDLEAAERLNRAALTTREATLPASHPDVARSHLALGKVLAARGEDDEAERHMRRAIDLFTGAFGPEYPATREAKRVLSAFLGERPARALPPTPSS